MKGAPSEGGREHRHRPWPPMPWVSSAPGGQAGPARPAHRSGLPSPAPPTAAARGACPSRAVCGGAGGGRAPRALACEKVSVSLSMRVVVTTVSGESRQKPSAARISRTAPTQPGIAAARRRGCDYGGRGR